MKPSVSVVIPTRDRSALLAQTLRTALWQRGADLEIIVVDDGSSDESPRMVAGVRDARIRLIRHDTSHGVSAARNRGIAEARGEWIAFLDDDDLWAPDKLRLQLEAANSTGGEWVYVGSVNVDLHNKIHGGTPPVPPERFMALLPNWNPMPGGCSNIMVRAEALADIGVFDTALHILADWELLLRLASHGRPACVSRPLVGYRLHPDNMSLDARGMLAELREVERRYGRVDRARIVRHLARQQLRRGQRRESLSSFVRAALEGGPKELFTDGAHDAVLIAAELWPGVRGRLRLPVSRRTTQRQQQLGSRDPNKEWKAEAEAWLSGLPETVGSTGAC
jgi:glycosyltransferase involved in cell wall biosynthesis